MSAVVLFTRDLRVHDHPALTAALAEGGLVVPLFVLDPAMLAVSANRARFLLESLVDLDRALQQRGGRLATRHGEVVAELLRVVEGTGATSVHLTGDVSVTARRREQALREALAFRRVALHVHPGNAVVDPGEVLPAGKDVYSIFTPYHRAWAQAPRRGVLPAPRRIALPEDLDLGAQVDPTQAFPDSLDLPPGGEGNARKHLEAYLHGDARHYAELRNDLAADATSRLSPYLRFGNVSANEVVARAGALGGSAGELVRQVAWRDFFGQLLAHDPSLAWRDFREPPNDVPPMPPDAPELLARWEEGLTGIPLVDAGMRQLRREGWIHNRARMVVASFLTRRLGVPWQEGAKVFMRWLVDGDPANNSGGWQWVAGTGTDPRRSRSFNPVRQAERFDPSGAYVRRYVRELADVPAPLIFAPWKEPTVLSASGYPAPILELPADVRVPGPGATPFRDEMPARPGQATLPV
jgi:deoxyribodipyrimidine photo-lyase